MNRVHDNMAAFEAETLTELTPFKGRSLLQVCHSVAVVHADLLLIHPFREGNGRLARWLADIMVAQADYPLPLYRFEGRGSREIRKRYLSAVQAGYLRRYEPLSDFFRDAVGRRLDLP